MTSETLPEESRAFPKAGGLLTDVRTRLGELAERLRQRALTTSLIGPSVEVALLLAWSLWVGRVYLNFDPTIWPIGGDYPLTIQPHYVWPYLERCGACVLWNGLINGGYPTFAESVAAIAHPLVILPTLAWGVINGSKITLVLSFFLAGLAQLWLGKVLRLGWIPRMWAAAMAVVGGHLAGRMEMGLVAMVFSTASASLVLAPALRLGETGRRRDAVILAVMTGLATLSGQLYIQVVLAFTLISMAAVYSLDGGLGVRPVWREYRFAGLLAALLAAVFLVPFLHFLPAFSKLSDPAFAGGQPLAYVPLNLVINDYGLYRTEFLGKIGFPAMYINYIGWVPVLLCFVLLRTVERKEMRRFLALLLPIAWIFMLSSSTVLKQLGKLAPTVVGGMRFPSLMAGLAIPLILALAAWGLDRLLRISWPKLTLELGPAMLLRFPVITPALVVVLLLSLRSAYVFSHDLLKTTVEPLDAAQMVAILKTESAQWVAPPIEHYRMPPLLEHGLKVTRIYRPVNPKDRQPPAPNIEFFQGEGDPSTPGYLGNVGPIGFVQRAENQYASVATGGASIPCQAVANLGHIDVTCTASEAGILTVTENASPGWQAYQGGASISLRNDPWLSVEAPAGEHHFEFRYKPWDVPLGLGLTGLGVLLAISSWLRNPPPNDPEAPARRASDRAQAGLPENAHP